MVLGAVVLIVWFMGGLMVVALLNLAQLATGRRRTPPHVAHGQAARIDSGSTTRSLPTPTLLTRQTSGWS